MLVHNPVTGDARVRKEARSLVEAGHAVDLFGYGDPAEAPAMLEGAKLTIVRKTPAVSFYGKGIWRLRDLASRMRGSPFLGAVTSSSTHPATTTQAIQILILVYHAVVLGGTVLVPAAALSNGHLTETLFGLSALFGIVLLVAAWQRMIVTVLGFVASLVFVAVTAVAVLPSRSFVLWLLLTTCIALTTVCTALLALRSVRSTGFFTSFQNRITLPAAHRHIANLLAKTVDPERYDVIHAHDIIALMSAMKLKRNNPELIVVWDAHELYPELSYKSKAAQKFMCDVIAGASGKIDHFITINNSFVDYYRRNFPKLPQATVLMNAARRVGETGTGDSPLRPAAGIADDQLVLLFQGGLSPDRGIDLLLEAAEHMPENWSLVFMGNGPLAKEVDMKIKALDCLRPIGRGAIAHIVPAPYHELASWTAGADLGIIPYRNSNLNHLYCTPNKLWEYPNAGVPILASGLVEMTSMIEEHHTGILLPREFSASDILRVLEQTGHETLERLKENCRKFNEVEHWGKYERRLTALYDGIAS